MSFGTGKTSSRLTEIVLHTIQYKGGSWSNRVESWVGVVRRRDGNPAYYSSVELGFRTHLPSRLPR